MATVSILTPNTTYYGRVSALVNGTNVYSSSVATGTLAAIPLKDARKFFRNESTVIATARTNAYSPARLARRELAGYAQRRQ